MKTFLGKQFENSIIEIHFFNKRPFALIKTCGFVGVDQDLGLEGMRGRVYTHSNSLKL